MIPNDRYPQAVEVLRRARRILLTTHVKPDGDALGSMAALRRWLLAQGKAVEIVVPTPPPARYAFLDPDGAVRATGPDAEGAADPPDLVAVVDTGTWQQLQNVAPLVRRAPLVLVIDHHLTQDDVGTIVLADTEACATAVLVHRLLTAAGARMDAETATYLFAGLACDTDWFRLPTSGPETLRLAAELVEAGAKPSLIYERLYWDNDLARMHLLGRALETLHSALGGRVMVMRLAQATLREAGTDAGDTENLINECMKVRGVEVGVMLVEAPSTGCCAGGVVRVSLRSRPGTDVLTVAERFGGGGHRHAAGACITASLDEAERQVLSALGGVAGSVPAGPETPCSGPKRPEKA